MAKLAAVVVLLAPPGSREENSTVLFPVEPQGYYISVFRVAPFQLTDVTV